MTLDEAIKHAEEVAERLRSDAHVYEDTALFKRSIKHNTEAEICEQKCERCEKCAEEHRQLAEWLKELKKYKETEITVKVPTKELVKELSELNKILSEEKPQGKWIFGSTLGHAWMKCSNCCVSQNGQTSCWSYCPNCGADMSRREE